MSDSLWLHGLQHARLPCPSLSPRVCSNSCPLSRWCHPIISSSVVPFSSHLLSFPASGSFPMRWFFASGSQSIWSFSFSISPSNENSGFISFRMDWFDLLAVQRTLRSLLQHHSSKASIPQCSAFFIVQFSHPYMTRGESIALTIWIFVGKVMSLIFNTLSRFVIAFLPRGKSLLISWLQSPSTVILEPKKIKCDTVSIVSPSMCCKVMGPDAMIFVFWMLSFKPALLELSSIISGWILVEVMALHIHTTPFYLFICWWTRRLLPYLGNCKYEQLLLWTLEGLHLFENSVLFSSNICSGVELLNHVVVLFLGFWGTSIVSAPLCIPTNSVQVFHFLHVLANICYLCSSWWYHSDRCEAICHCGFYRVIFTLIKT